MASIRCLQTQQKASHAEILSPTHCPLHPHLVLLVQPCRGWRHLIHNPHFGTELIGHKKCGEMSTHKPHTCTKEERVTSLPPSLPPSPLSLPPPPQSAHTKASGDSLALCPVGSRPCHAHHKPMPAQPTWLPPSQPPQLPLNLLLVWAQSHTQECTPHTTAALL